MKRLDAIIIYALTIFLCLEQCMLRTMEETNKP